MSNEKKYKCPKCPKSFDAKSSLNQHTKAKHRNKVQPKNQKAVKKIDCTFCNRKFKNTIALKQHVNAKHEKDFVCSECGKGFSKESSLTQHIGTKHGKIIKSKPTTKRKTQIKPNLGVYEHISFGNNIKIVFKNIIKRKKPILMDECVGNDESVILALENRYQVIPMPSELLSHKDNDLRLIIKEKQWGLVSKDFEMILKARKVKIKPVYFLKEVRGHRALIKISKRNSDVT